MPPEKPTKSFSAMADLNALLWLQLRECQPKLGEKEQRIVSESARATRLPQNHSFGMITKCLDDLSISRCRDHAYEPSAAAIVWNFGKFGT
jgi:hypothetical protein